MFVCFLRYFVHVVFPTLRPNNRSWLRSVKHAVVFHDVRDCSFPELAWLCVPFRCFPDASLWPVCYLRYFVYVAFAILRPHNRPCNTTFFKPFRCLPDAFPRCYPDDSNLPLWSSRWGYNADSYIHVLRHALERLTLCLLGYVQTIRSIVVTMTG